MSASVFIGNVVRFSDFISNLRDFIPRMEQSRRFESLMIGNGRFRSRFGRFHSRDQRVSDSRRSLGNRDALLL